ncbi:hypothetical protein BCY89_21815 [Sphingobacterium siyangense]|uniref:Uncharacterized protein n=1 Tax=Sphingobacterium siyangense TaxID=459529 RepID=A0A420G791_9SPHI|nr:hypothetical protein BCY89_21815 [Sphingobacterium siyangense]
MISVALLPMENEIKSTKIKYGYILATYLSFDDQKYKDSVQNKKLNDEYYRYYDFFSMAFIWTFIIIFRN